MAPTPENASARLPRLDDMVSREFGKCARRFDAQAIACTRGLHTSLFIQRFKQGLLGRP